MPRICGHSYAFVRIHMMREWALNTVNWRQVSCYLNYNYRPLHHDHERKEQKKKIKQWTINSWKIKRESDSNAVFFHIASGNNFVSFPLVMFLIYSFVVFVVVKMFVYFFIWILHWNWKSWNQQWRQQRKRMRYTWTYNTHCLKNWKAMKTHRKREKNGYSSTKGEYE